MQLDHREKVVGRLSAQKEKDILEVALKIVLEQGLGALSIDKIAKQVGASKSTIYRRYQNKIEIFELLSVEMVNAFVNKIDAVLVNKQQASPAKVLYEIAAVIQKSMKQSEHINLLRELIAEIPRNKHLNTWVKSDFNPIVPQRLIKYFSTLIAAGQMEHPDPVHAASTFMTLCSDGYYTLMDTWESHKAIKVRVETDVKMFIKGCSITEFE